MGLRFSNRLLTSWAYLAGGLLGLAAGPAAGQVPALSSPTPHPLPGTAATLDRLGLDGRPAALAVLADGRILLGGDFGTYGGRRCQGLVRLQPGGRLDTTFVFNNPEYDNLTVTALAVQPDGRLLVAVATRTDQQVLRLLANGQHDTTFKPFQTEWEEGVAAMALQPNGRVLLLSQNQPGPYAVARLNPNGSPDSTFAWQAPSAAPEVEETARLLLLADGRVLLGGSFMAAGDTSAAGDPRDDARTGPLLCLRPDGEPDPGFAPYAAGRQWQAEAVAALADGRLLLASSQVSRPQQRHPTLHRLLANGQPDPAFVPARFTPYTQPAVLAVQPDGQLLLGTQPRTVYPRRAWHTHSGPRWRRRCRERNRQRWAARHIALLRLGPDGRRDPRFRLRGLRPGYGVEALALLPDGRLLVSGYFEALGSTRRHYQPLYLACLRPDGSLDPTFGQ